MDILNSFKNIVNILTSVKVVIILNYSNISQDSDDNN